MVYRFCFSSTHHIPHASKSFFPVDIALFSATTTLFNLFAEVALFQSASFTRYFCTVRYSYTQFCIGNTTIWQIIFSRLFLTFHQVPFLLLFLVFLPSPRFQSLPNYHELGLFILLWYLLIVFLSPFQSYKSQEPHLEIKPCPVSSFISCSPAANFNI